MEIVILLLDFGLQASGKFLMQRQVDIESKIQSVLNDKTVAILVVHNDDLRMLSPHMQQTLDDSVEPTVIAIGGKGESTNLRDKIKQAVGVDLWK